MASRLARNAVGAARLRPRIATRHLAPIATTLTAHRCASNVPSEPPAKRAQSIIDNLPGTSLISKTAIVSASAGVAAYLISNEFYVVNEETITMVCTLATFWAIAHYLGPMHKAWADKILDHRSNLLETAKQDHHDVVQKRVDDMQQLGSVVDITKGLFEVSKETAQLEAQVYELEQKTAVAAEAKSVLDSWVRYEGQIKSRQQQELAENVIAKIQKELESPKTLQQILQQSIADVEKIVASKAQ